MKKLVLSALFLGFIATSCGSKEPQMSSTETDSTAVVDTLPAEDTTTMENPDTGQMPMDSSAAPVR